jgi:sugar lactone lactonase YvrE
MTALDRAIELRIDCRNELGETPVWCAQESALYWIDVTAPGRVFFWKTCTDAVDFWEFPELVTGIDPMDDGGLLVRGTSDIVRFDLVTHRRQRLFTLPDGSGSSRFNDGHCDRAGRLWVGTMSNNLRSGATGIAASAGQIWCIGDGRASSIDAHLSCPNAICWSPDYRTFYIADSGNGWLYAHPFDEDTGTLMPRRPFFSSGTLGIPDGAAVDQEGFLWNARWGAGMLIRISPAGHLDRSVPLPVSQPTACCFGDDDLRTLYITTARYGLSPGQLATEPLSGGVFSLRVDVAGLPLPAFRAPAAPIHHCHGADLP